LRDNFKPLIGFSALETGVNPEIEAKKSTHHSAFDVRNSLVVLIFQRSEEQTLQAGLLFDNFKARLDSSIFRCISKAVSSDVSHD
jgi:hypothetical protein